MEYQANRPTKKSYLPRDVLIVMKDCEQKTAIKDYLTGRDIQVYEGKTDLDAITFFTRSHTDVVIVEKGLESIVASIEKSPSKKGIFTVIVRESEEDVFPNENKRPKADKTIPNKDELVIYVTEGEMLADYLTNGDAQYGRLEDERILDDFDKIPKAK